MFRERNKQRGMPSCSGLGAHIENNECEGEGPPAIRAVGAAPSHAPEDSMAGTAALVKERKRVFASAKMMARFRPASSSRTRGGVGGPRAFSRFLEVGLETVGRNSISRKTTHNCFRETAETLRRTAPRASPQEKCFPNGEIQRCGPNCPPPCAAHNQPKPRAACRPRRDELLPRNRGPHPDRILTGQDPITTLLQVLLLDPAAHRPTSELLECR
ncbi:hypothetical protein EVAR_96487_1 [Eumeta japonica]|uniref:Uncharacterized protein n=1 Tax=Eumeta variegata TaxID=151549 RepID=A0A4C1ZXE1_EUMVA|nr:hypothetical protein EVAR_96487_1 [Eumeta japonica]